MNKLLFHEGGQPLYLDDLDFIQSAFAETIKALISTYGDVILSGCEIVPPVTTGHLTKYSWGKGYIALGGEIYRVDNGSFEGKSDATLYWKVISKQDQKENFENTTEHNVYEYKYVTLSDVVNTADVYIAKDDVKKIGDVLKNKVSEAFEIPAPARVYNIADNPSASLTIWTNKSTIYCSVFIYNYTSVNLPNGLLGSYPVGELSEKENTAMGRSGVIVITSGAFNECQAYILDIRSEGQVYLRNMDGSLANSISKIGAGEFTFVTNI